MSKPRQVIRWSEPLSPVVWLSAESAPAWEEVARFPALVTGMTKYGAAIRVEMVGGQESRVIHNRRRGWVVPRRWRKPR